MKRKFSDLKNSVVAKRGGKPRSGHYTATCPICMFSHSVDVLGSEKSAELLATDAILRHLKGVHKDEIDVDA